MPRLIVLLVCLWSGAVLGQTTSSGPADPSNHNDICDLPGEDAHTAPLDCAGRPIVVANYFISFRGLPDQVIGPSLRYRPDALSPSVGRWHDSVTLDYWLAPADGTPGTLARGPGRTLGQWRSDLQAALGKPLPGVILRIDYTLMVPDNAFAAEPIGAVEILGTRAGTTRTIAHHALYPQDFQAAGRFQTFSLLMAQFVPEADETLELCVQTTGRRTIALQAIEVVPLAFESYFGQWSGMPWKGGTDTGHFYRQFNPLWILSSVHHKDGSVSRREPIDGWRRDILVSRPGVYPYIGPYDQADPAVLRYQVRQAKAAGIDAFKIYQYYATRAGAETLDESRWQWKALQALLDIAAEESFAIFLNDSTLSEQQWIGGPYGYDDAVHNLGLVAARGWLDHPGYLKINGRPVYDLPAIFETDPDRLIDCAARLNARYRQITGRDRDLFQLYTPMSTYITRNEDGPFNMQVIFLDQYYLQEDRWKRYFVCDPPPRDVPDLLARGRCLYDPAQPVSGFGVFLATLLERDHLRGFRRMPGVTGLYDWTAQAVPMFPQYLTPVEGKYRFRGPVDPGMSARTYKLYVDSAHAHGYAAAITLSPGHDKSGSYAHVDYEMQPRVEADGKTLMWRRLLRDALAARPDFLMIENWNGYGEGVIIEPCEGFTCDRTERADPDIFLRILAESLGQAYRPPLIPPQIVDPLRLPGLPGDRLEPTPHTTPDRG